MITIFGALVYSQTVKFAEISTVSAAPAAFLMAIGGLVCVISFLGSCGAFMESYCLLMTFSSIVFIIISGEIVSLGLLYHYRYELEDAVVNGMKDAIVTYKNSNESAKIIDQLQREMSCCGGDGLNDWNVTFSTDMFPDSCCRSSGNHQPISVNGTTVEPLTTTPSTSGQCTRDNNGLWDTPCRKAIENYVSSNVTNLIITVSVFLVVQVVSLVASCSMARSTRKDYYRFV